MLNEALIALISAALVFASQAAAAFFPGYGALPDSPSHCRHIDQIDVPGAQVQQTACLADLTTASTVASGHTDPMDWAGLHAAGTTNPSGVRVYRSTGTSPIPRCPTPTTGGTTTRSS
jgi:hypothetical protein